MDAKLLEQISENATAIRSNINAIAQIVSTKIDWQNSHDDIHTEIEEC